MASKMMGEGARRFRRGVFVCVCCGKRTSGAADSGSEICGRCYWYGGQENRHSDNAHGTPNCTEADTSDCPVCNGESCHEEG